MKKFLTVLALIIILVCMALFGLWFWVRSQLAAVATTDSSHILIEIPPGTSASETAKLLENKGLIRNTMLFLLYAAYTGTDKKIQAGTYELSASWDVPTILANIQKNRAVQKLQILEGWRREEVGAAIAKIQGERFDWDEFMRLTDNAEGKLFPDTYLLSPGMSTEQIVNLLLSQYQKTWTEIASQYSLAQNPDDILILASLVEREAASDRDKRFVAGILDNRLRIGMPLQVDATLQYPKATARCSTTRTNCDWWIAPLGADTEINSPYNTYLYATLPPTPICNPGKAALQAVIDPQRSDYLFYLTDTEGTTHFAKTYEEHLVNINRYLR